MFKGPLRSSKAEAGSFFLHWPDPPKLSVSPHWYLANLVRPVTMEKKKKKKKETLLIGLYDLGNRMLLQMIYFESWFRFSENKLNPLHQRPERQTQSFLVWKMWLLFNVEISQGYKEGKKKLNSFHVTKSLWDVGYNALTVSRYPDHITKQKGGSVWFTPFLNCVSLMPLK